MKAASPLIQALTPETRMLQFPVLLVTGLGLVFAPPLHADPLAPLAWLGGCWSNPQGDAGSGEYWQPLAGGTMLGVGRLIRDGRTVEHEFLRLHVGAQNQVIYTATPSRQKETAFTATRIADGTATFENPAHDFPQKIIYSRIDRSGMSVRIEGMRNGTLRAMEFQFERAPCPAQEVSVTTR